MHTAVLRVREQDFPWLQALCVGVIAGGALLALSQLSVVAAGIGFVLIFWTIAFMRPEYALLLILAASPFPNSVSAGLPVQFAVSELSLALIIPVYLLKMRRAPSIGPMALPVAAYLLVCSASMAWGGVDKTAIVSIFQMFLYLVIAVTIFAHLVPDPVRLLLPLKGLVVVVSLLALIGMATGFSFMSIHKNNWGASLSTGLVVAVELWFSAERRKQKRLYMIAVVVISAALVLSVSRGGWMAAMAGVSVIIALRRQYKLLMRVAMGMVPVVAVCWMLLPEDMQDYAFGFEQERWNIKSRWESIDFAVANFSSSPLVGVGVGLRKEFDATNIVLTTLAETGVLGLLAFAAVQFACLRMVWRTQRCFQRSDPLYSLVALGGALVMARLAHGLVDHYWSRGAITPAWCAAGMALMLYLLTRRGTVRVRRLVVP